MKVSKLLLGGALCLGTFACDAPPANEKKVTMQTEASADSNQVAPVRTDIYATVKLTSDLSALSEKEKQMLPKLIEVAQIMDSLFWYQAYGDKGALLAKVNDPNTQRFLEINYGPWDRLANNAAFLPGVGEKPKTANFYPHDMTEAEFEALAAEDKKSLYTYVERDSEGNLKTIAYSEKHQPALTRAAELLREAAALAEDAGLKKHLELRADALLSDDFYESDKAWLDMRKNGIDIICGPIENYEDKLFGYKAAYEAYVLVKDKVWSERLQKYAPLLPKLQKGMPVEDAYKAEEPGSDSDLIAADVVYYAGDCNAGSKTIAVNLPNDEKVQLEKGTRRTQIKNAMRAKFDKILLPLSDVLIAEDQRKHITFDAFFGNTMFHEVAHGLGIKETITGKGSVREALKDVHSSLEEGKADILGLYMVTELRNMGELTEGELMDNYVTFMAGIFRSVRFGAASAHGKANMIRFNFFQEMGAFKKNEDGTYSVVPEKMQEAVAALTQKILKLQGDGDYEAAKQFTETMGVIKPDLQADLDKLSAQNIPVDIVFEQGTDVLGL